MCEEVKSVNMSSVCVSVKVKSRCLGVWGVVSISVRVTIGVCGYMNVRIRLSV